MLIMCMMLRVYLHDDTQWLVFVTGFSIGYLVAELSGAGREKKMSEEKKYGWGGRRPNQTGRPKGTTNPDGVRKQHQVRAYEDEWLLIKEFAGLVKKDIARAGKLMEEYRK